MAQLAIEGHKIRGSEVIELLEMLGGKNIQRLNGALSKCYYIIDNKSISVCMSVDDNYVVYTLEEFKDKFPYKVGDKVKTIYGKIGIVKQLVWSNKDNAVRYELEDDEDSLYFANELQPYKEETITIDDFKANTKEWLLDKLQSMSKDNALQAICNLYNELHKPKYPKTFIEVLDFWHPDRQLEDDYQSCYKKDLMENFQDLLYARDAYWKIAGNWEPNWSEETNKFTISNKCNKIYLNNTAWYSEVLAFPTAEMRDAFYDNFKDLIEKCKELL